MPHDWEGDCSRLRRSADDINPSVRAVEAAHQAQFDTARRQGDFAVAAGLVGVNPAAYEQSGE